MKVEAPLVWLIKRLVNPLTIAVSLMVITFAAGVKFDLEYILLCAVSFLLAAKIFAELDVFDSARLGFVTYGREVLLGWGLLIGALLFFGFALKVSDIYSRRVLLTWFVLVPLLLPASHWFARRLLLRLRAVSKLRSAVIIGANELGHQMAQRIRANPYLFTNVDGFFDDRSRDRLDIEQEDRLLGELSQLPGYIKSHNINVIYVTLPMTAQPRILRLLDELRDTTASIYFVPDLFLFDLVQARFGEVSGMPVVAVCETPFIGVNGVIKRVSDVILSALFLLLSLPVMLGIALAIKLTSPGPVIFRQRRYGEDGDEFTVWKFRTMTVQEDGGEIKQATREDRRITPIGGLLRRSSLDELPQLWNVLQGRMSLVGPRPHAVAHNEMYRSLIKGYMMRHKVKPGITGLAQVNGLRGETDTLEKMSARIKYDIDYLRNWSLSLDLWIIARTMLVIFRDKNAY